MGGFQVETKDAYELIHEGVLALGRAERQGFRIDVEYCKKKKEHITRKITWLQKKLVNTEFHRQWKRVYGAKTNLDSNHQLAYILYDAMKIPKTKTTGKGKGATDEEALSQLDVPELQWMLQIRKLRKIRDTYLDAFYREQVDGYMHPFFSLHTVRTFRSSSSNPNFQNIPKRDQESMQICRRAIFPRPDHQLLAMDFSGIEVRIACCYTEDDKLIYDTLHGDMHKDMAIELYLLDELDKHHAGEKNLRQGGKNGFVFPQFYGDYHGNCAPNLLEWAKRSYLKDDTPALEHLEKKKLIKLDKQGQIKNSTAFLEHVKKIEDDFWNQRYKKYTKWKKKTWETYQKTGAIKLLTGFTYKGVATKNELLNAPIQGSAFHCLLWTFIQVDKKMRVEGWNSALCGQIHDEMLVDTDPKELMKVCATTQHIVRNELMKAWSWIIVPMEIEADLCPVNGSWADKQSYELPEVHE